ncbi:tripartite tricarboxylate transporter substrate binding protein [Lacisediminimonas profundi]|uniref:tripartite tricarboxylate transporter substrate binding protein n=1 Tax=Lacisediminimonas profundi TaxID=2603856 RepID=UPI001F4F73F1|nr:tripartite tricarboxylate transporter substrate binding protein [Lacisediminimonas profundi]
MKNISTAFVRRFRSALLGLATLACFSTGEVLAQDYPNRSIRIVVPFSAGGPTDAQARALALKLSEEFKQSVFVENRPGGASNIGTGAVAKATPDGYTLLFCSATLAINPSLFDKLPFNALKDFAPITLFSFVPSVLATHPGVPARDLKELLSLLRANPEKYSFASGGTGSTQQLAGERMKLMAGVQAIHVPYKGEAPAMSDLLGGQVPMIFASIATAAPHIKSGRIRAIAVTSAKRNPALPNVPAMAESGLPGFDVMAWFGILAPAGTPREIVQKLNAAMVKIIQSEEISAKIIAQGGAPAANSPEEFSAFLNAEVPRWSKLIKESGVTVN